MAIVPGERLAQRRSERGQRHVPAAALLNLYTPLNLYQIQTDSQRRVLMKIAVLLKQTFDTEARIVIDAGGQISR
ncbi:MAG: hypothetical protein K6T29_09690, partial [Peptococcaceae bacterium]|nr:hypothetical protein [Peptococcaceae bacterium]